MGHFDSKPDNLVFIDLFLIKDTHKKTIFILFKSFRMQKNAVYVQTSSLKTHPHVKNVQLIGGNRLLKIDYCPENALESSYKLKIELPLNYPE